MTCRFLTYDFESIFVNSDKNKRSSHKKPSKKLMEKLLLWQGSDIL